MKPTANNRKLIMIVLFIALLAVLLGTVTACEGMGLTPSTEETPEPSPEETGPTVINTGDAAILAVYQRLLEQAKGYEAKLYLADFYTYCDNWSVQSEYFKDGSGTWHVVVDMTEDEDWELRRYWQQASWLVFKDGEVIPSNLFQANAVRIEADLQALSPEATAEAD